MPQGRERSGEPQRAGDATNPTDQKRVWGPNPGGHGARQQTAEGRGPHRRRGVKTHHPPALVFINDGLQQGVADGHLRHEPQPRHDH